MVMTAAASGVL